MDCTKEKEDMGKEDAEEEDVEEKDMEGENVEKIDMEEEDMDEVSEEKSDHNDVKENVNPEGATTVAMTEMDVDPKNIRAYLKKLGADDIEPDRFMSYLWSQGLFEMADIPPEIIAKFREWSQGISTTGVTMKGMMVEGATGDRSADEAGAIFVDQTYNLCEPLEIKKEEKALEALLKRITQCSDDFARRGDTFALMAKLMQAEVSMLARRWNDAMHALEEIKSSLSKIDQNDLFRFYRMVARAATEVGLYDYSYIVLGELKGLQRGLGENAVEKIRTYIEYGMLLTKRGDYRGALGYLDIAYMHLEEKNVPDFVQCSTTLAQAEMEVGMFHEAELHQRRAVDILKETEGQKKSFRTAVHNLAQLLKKSGNMLGAKWLFQDVVECCEKEMGKDHAETLTIKVHLGDTYFALGMLSNAAESYEEVIQGREKLFNDTPDHPDILSIKEKLSRVLLEIARKQGAIGHLWVF